MTDVASKPIVPLLPSTNPTMNPVPRAPGSGAGIVDAMRHDLDTGLALVDRQLGLPLRHDGLWPMLALFVAALVIAWPLRLFVIRLLGRFVRPRAQPGSGLLLALAVLTVIVTTAAFGIAGALVVAACQAGLYLLPISTALIGTAAAGLGVIGLAIGIGNAVQEVEDPEHRAYPDIDVPNRVFGFYLPVLGVMLAAAGLVERGSALLHASAPSRLLVSGVTLGLEAMLIASVLIAVGRRRDAALAHGRYPAVRASQALTGIAWATLILAILGFVAGHVSFAMLLVQELIWCTLVAAFALLLVQAIGRMTDWGGESDRALRRFAVHVIGIAPERVVQVGLLLGAVLTVLVWLVAASLMLAPLGGDGVVLVDQLRGGPLLADLQKLNIAPLSILAGIGVLIAGVALTRMLRHWLERRYLPATHLDVGARAAIITGIGYASTLVVLLAAVSAAGINLGKVTLIASALSVGIGFGLQSIIQNFVSGIILLGERPIKVGDWVTAAGAEGSVHRIRVRATELMTADGSVAIVPNSSFISGAVINRAGEGIAGRVEVSLRVGGLPTAAESRDTVMKLVEGTEGVLAEPAPRLLLKDRNGDGFGFTLQVYADRRRPVADVRSQLLYHLVDGMPEDLKLVVS